jgi:hypothetical protein
VISLPLLPVLYLYFLDNPRIIDRHAIECVYTMHAVPEGKIPKTKSLLFLRILYINI